jgi:hypothetical protein
MIASPSPSLQAASASSGGLTAQCVRAYRKLALIETLCFARKLTVTQVRQANRSASSLPSSPRSCDDDESIVNDGENDAARERSAAGHATFQRARRQEGRGSGGVAIESTIHLLVVRVVVARRLAQAIALWRRLPNANSEPSAAAARIECVLMLMGRVVDFGRLWELLDIMPLRERRELEHRYRRRVGWPLSRGVAERDRG